MLLFFSEPIKYLGAPAPWSFEARRNVNDPPTWCGAAWTTLCGGRGDPPSFVEKLLSGNQDQGDRGVDHERDLIAEKRYS